jgi:hypothetical protein
MIWVYNYFLKSNSISRGHDSYLEVAGRLVFGRGRYWGCCRNGDLGFFGGLLLSWVFLNLFFMEI